jgi:hypothetical protein
MLQRAVAGNDAGDANGAIATAPLRLAAMKVRMIVLKVV